MSMILVPNGMLPQMVSHSRPYYEETQLPFRRYSRNHGYPLSDRDVPSSSNNNVYARNHYVGGQESHNDNNSPGRDEIPRTRSRIPVACVRCRRRKIRCSGDNGVPCTNCKTAGNEQCQFLRVSSTETTMIKNETPVSDFDYGSASSRLNCNLVSCGPHYHTIQTAPLPNTYSPYRNNSLNSYQFPVKQHFYPLPNYAEIGEEHVDYGLNLNMNTFQGDQLGSNYNPTHIRTWASTPQIKGLPFLDQHAPIYSHGQSAYNTTNFDTRSHISPEPKPPQLANLPQTFPPQSLPAPINTGMDRMLPFPAPMPINRTTQISQFLSSADGLMAGSQGRGSYIDYNSLQTFKSDGSNANSNYNANASSNENGNPSYNGNDVASSNNSGSNHSTPENSTMSNNYSPLTTQSPESLHSTQATYSTPPFPLATPQSQQQNIYTSPHNELVTVVESSGSYDHNPTSYDRRGSQLSQASYNKKTSVSSQGGYHPDGLPSLSESAGTLANGHRYYPASGPGQYPVPAIDIQIQPQPRRPSGLAA